jgi:hypothetical protein
MAVTRDLSNLRKSHAIKIALVLTVIHFMINMPIHSSIYKRWKSRWSWVTSALNQHNWSRVARWEIVCRLSASCLFFLRFNSFSIILIAKIDTFVCVFTLGDEWVLLWSRVDQRWTHRWTGVVSKVSPKGVPPGQCRRHDWVVWQVSLSAESSRSLTCQWAGGEAPPGRPSCEASRVGRG